MAWTPWKTEDTDLEAPTQTEVTTTKETLTDAQLRELLTAKLSDVLDPPSLDQAVLKFREVSAPEVSLWDAMCRTREFCKRVT